MKADSSSESCRIMNMAMGEFVTDASTNISWQAALVHVDCSTFPPQMHSKKQVFSTPYDEQLQQRDGR